ncbi:uncharacterized protein METZ01_LOCUS427140, partial [marine metagenome]
MGRYKALLLFTGLVFWSCGEQEPVIPEKDNDETIELLDCPSLDDINEESLCTASDGTDGVTV